MELSGCGVASPVLPSENDHHLSRHFLAGPTGEALVLKRATIRHLSQLRQMEHSGRGPKDFVGGLVVTVLRINLLPFKQSLVVLIGEV
jgi:hypothetical protein